jgi:hypothetical protein
MGNRTIRNGFLRPSVRVGCGEGERPARNAAVTVDLGTSPDSRDEKFRPHHPEPPNPVRLGVG